MTDRISSFEDIDCLHIYGQFVPHDRATIRGNRGGLRALRDALTEALEGASTASAQVMVNDGEGYEVLIEPVNLTSLCGRGPYIEELARDLMGQEREWLQKWARRREDAEDVPAHARSVPDCALEVLRFYRDAWTPREALDGSVQPPRVTTTEAPSLDLLNDKGRRARDVLDRMKDPTGRADPAPETAHC